MALSPASDRLVYCQTNLTTLAPSTVENDIWRLQIGEINQPTRLISSTRDDAAPQYSPDGKRIAFTSNRGGPFDIWVSAADGSNQRQLTFFGENGTPRWSPDSARIAFDSSTGATVHIWIVPSVGGQPRRLTAGTATDDSPAWSHDGEWIYFTSDRTGRFEIWKMPVRGGQARQVTRNGGYCGVESVDGKFFYYTIGISGDTSIWRVPTDGGEEVRILDHLSFGMNFDVTRDGIYFIQADDSGSSIRFYRFTTRRISVVARIEGQYGRGLGVSSDGRWLLFCKHNPPEGDLMLVENVHLR
jgi:Tol biopolymer transport system component